MRNKMASKYVRFSWSSFVILSIFTISEVKANEEWSDYGSEEVFYNVYSSKYQEKINAEDLAYCEFESQGDLDEENTYAKKLQFTPREAKYKAKSKITSSFADRIKPYRMSSDHPAKKRLDSIFKNSQPTKNLDTLEAAGFVVVSLRPFSFAVIAKHPDLPGYLEKLYLDSEHRKKNGKEGWQWLVQRCEGAANIRKLIKEKKLQHFSVPDKWIYELPKSKEKGQPCILVVTDMELVSQDESHAAWKTIVNEEVLDELYIILSHGYASSHVGWNIPYSKSGKFSCIDTEYAKRKPNYVEVESYLSDEMKVYWRSLVNSGDSWK